MQEIGEQATPAAFFAEDNNMLEHNTYEEHIHQQSNQAASEAEAETTEHEPPTTPTQHEATTPEQSEDTSVPAETDYIDWTVCTHTLPAPLPDPYNHQPDRPPNNRTQQRPNCDAFVYAK